MATASDLRAILSLPQQTPGASGSSKPSKAKGSNAKKPEGISRELYSLIGDSAPAVVAQYARPKFKPKLDIAKNRSKWAWKSFTNPARQDSFKLSHWAKAGNGQEEPENQFAQYNKPSQVYTYTSEEYAKYLEDDEWSKEETDYLFFLAHDFDLRFLIMADRYYFEGGPSRQIEDLKDRYYSVCRRLIRNRPWAGDEASRNHTLSSYMFDVAQERMRKDYLRGLYHRTPEQIAEEELLYVEVKRLEENEQKWARDRDGLLKMLAGVESGLPNLKADWDVISGVVVSDRDRKSSRRGLDGMGGYGSASDIQNCIWRHEPSQTGVGVTKSSSALPVHLRSTRIPTPRAQLLPKITAVLAEHGISISRLVMPTRANLERMEALQTAATVLLETKKAVDRVDMEIRTLKEAQKEAREIEETGNVREERAQSGDGDVDMDVDDDGEGDDNQRQESSAPGRHQSSSVMRESEEPSGSVGPQSVAEKRMSSQARKRSMSASSNATSSATRGGNKKTKRE